MTMHVSCWNLDKVISHRHGLSPEVQKHGFLLRRKVQIINKILRTASLKCYPKGVPFPGKSQERLFI